jgi:hypothetical protein
MVQIQLRTQAHIESPSDLRVNVQEATFDYLMSSLAKEIRVSAYFDRDYSKVEAEYQELFLSDECPFESIITKIIPGSRTRTGISLPGPMKEGEQLVVIVTRSPRI